MPRARARRAPDARRLVETGARVLFTRRGRSAVHAPAVPASTAPRPAGGRCRGAPPLHVRGGSRASALRHAHGPARGGFRRRSRTWLLPSDSGSLTVGRRVKDRLTGGPPFWSVFAYGNGNIDTNAHAEAKRTNRLYLTSETKKATRWV